MNAMIYQFILAVLLVGCGQQGMNPSHAFLGDEDVVAENYPTPSGEMTQQGHLIIPNAQYGSWNGSKLQGNRQLKVIAVE